MTAYNNFAKRDGSIAKSCISGEKMIFGKEFAKAAARWYESIAIKGPTL